MSLRAYVNDPTLMMRVGMSFLIVASLTRWFVHPSAALSPSAVDFATGILYGLAIGCLLASIVAQRRRRSG